METAEPSSIPVIAVTTAVGAVILLMALVCNTFSRRGTSSNTKSIDKTQNFCDEKNGMKKNKDKDGNKKAKAASKILKKGSAHIPFSHPWLACTLKGHSSSIVAIDFSPNGKYMISASDDRELMLWSTKDFQQKEHKYIRGNVGLDSATQVAFSPDSRAFIASLENENALRIFRLGKKEDGSNNVTMAGTITFPKKHEAEIVGIGISSTGRFIMSCGADTKMIVWDLKGEVLTTIDTHQMKISCAKVSQCGRFVAAAGFTPDVKVWEVCFDKALAYKEAKRAFELKGHHAAVYSFDFNSDSRRMASVSKDGTWKLWDTDVQYAFEQDPKQLFTGKVPFSSPSLIALSPDGRTTAIGVDSTISIWNGVTGIQDQLLENVHADSMTCLTFDNSGHYLATAGSRHIQMIHNVTGYKATLNDLEEKLKKATGSGAKERLQQQIQDTQSALDAIIPRPSEQSRK